ncbi:undecaprenyldiphospho-muramoylpentapeptide beta-N-acetylglucosaminyltransferase [Sphingobacterium sp. HJSM2_6]|uniref:undecaprenyldiphospho-muramoylpentapeptide beta-N-acetylglucosaminyltransferase n=1 Tax=Sphingobacterium sp. HJSM2_6 TaxID=3366264 RepID=UPI003BC11885
MAHKVIISGGGTGGHIFPAIAIANALKQIAPDTEILFVGANGKMEMERVPAAGYEIVGLDIAGINRQSMLKNIALPFKMLKSLWKARKVLKQFKAEAAIGVGGYASGPLLMMANMIGLPTIIQEQNSYAGLTNKKLGQKARKICVAYEGMERFFPKERILLTGNPIRKAAVKIAGKREEAIHAFQMDLNKKTLLVTGGSLGALTLNDCIEAGIPQLVDAGIQVIWQCGSYYYEQLQAKWGENLPVEVKLMPFLDRMDYAYAAADIIVARAGAGTISELCVIGKPVVLVPSPNVSDDHQTKNAMALANHHAAIVVKDQDARQDLIQQIVHLINHPNEQAVYGENIKKLALPDADEVIAKEILNIIKN